jgi:sortase B
MKKKRRLKKQVLYVILILFLIPFIISSINIYKWYKDHNKYEKIVEEIEQHINIDEKTAIPKLTIDFDELEKINAETVAYLYVKNTKINYPVVKTKDNDYYLDHAFNKTKNQSGWIFMDYRNNLDENDKNIIIYGHNKINGTMFGTMKDTLKSEWYEDKDNLIIQLHTKDKTYQYQVFSIYRIEAEEYYVKTDFNDDFQEFVDKLKSRSDVKIDTEIKDTKQILTLSTCIGYGDDRLVLHARLIDSDK